MEPGIRDANTGEPPRVQVVHTEFEGSSYANRNKGLQIANSSIASRQDAPIPLSYESAGPRQIPRQRRGLNALNREVLTSEQTSAPSAVACRDVGPTQRSKRQKTFVTSQQSVLVSRQDTPIPLYSGNAGPSQMPRQRRGLSASTPGIVTSPQTSAHLGVVYENIGPAQRLKRQRTMTASPQSALISATNTAIQSVTRSRRAQRVALPRVLPAEVGQVSLQAGPLKLPQASHCTKCLAKRFAYESLHFCCGNGQVKIANNIYPPVRLYTSNDKDALDFRRCSRAYNNLFAFSSIGGEFDATMDGNGVYVFKLHGQMYHFLPNLLPGDHGPRYLQLYFYDGQHEANNRWNCFDNLQQDIIEKLIHISANNPYARFFRSLREIDVAENTRIMLHKNPVMDQWRANAPTSDEVAVIWPDNLASSECEGPHIVVTGKSTGTHRIRHYYGCYDPLQYPLLFPRGESGWKQGLSKSAPDEDQPPGQPSATTSLVPNNVEDLLIEEELGATRAAENTGKYISCREYYAYKLQNRPDNLILRAGRCFQQYIVDMYVKVESTRLDFFRLNQDKIRAELYQGVIDSLYLGENIAANIGRRVILPPTFIGGPRDIKKRYLNAMALVQKYGKPDLFITMTCNSNWPEIQQELAPRELAQNRPDLVARVFRSKLLALKKKIMEEKIFGDVAALIYVVEFQKRGLPHAHLLIILKPEFRMRCPADYDRFVCAEIPSMANENLRSLVLRHMMHGPCGALNKESPCMHHKNTKGRCKYAFPKNFQTETTNNLDGYPMYRRRNTGESGTVRHEQLDNRWVIPYNPYLLSLFECHLNVEVCSTIKSVKYLYKYVYKGHDTIAFTVVDNETVKPVDEIEQYQSGRWVSPCEAAWRIFGFDLFEMYPSVMLLQVHMPNMQNVTLRTGELLSNVVADKRCRTHLTAFFEVNTRNRVGHLLYGEFTEQYRWDSKSRKWVERKTKVVVIGRIAFVSPVEGERYYLILLLIHIRAPKSFNDLLTFYGHKCASFQESAIKHGLLEENNAADLCLTESCEVQMPNAVRRLFAVVLIFCQPQSPETLWNKHYETLSADYRHSYPQQPNKVRQLTLKSLEQYLESMGKSLKTFNLDHLRDIEDVELHRTRDIVDALDTPIPQECLECSSRLNPAQRTAFDAIIEHVTHGKAGAFFIDGPGGTGKTYLYNALYGEVRLMNKIVLPTATSGIAASNLPSGRTAHSRFKIPIDTNAALACDVPKQSSLAALIKECSLIIWDEASMARRENVESLDTLLRDLCDPRTLFGGKVVVFGGDFRQVLPVVPHKTQQEAVAASLVNSSIWPKLIKFRLSENMRAREDPDFATFLLSLGNGELQTEEYGLVRLPLQIVHPCCAANEPIKALGISMFPEINEQQIDPEIFTERAILTPLNEDVDLINSVLIDQFTGDAMIYKSFDIVLDDHCNLYPTEFVNKLCPGGMSPHELILKIGCPVILLRNLLPAFGLCNGTRLVCTRFFPNLVQCVITTGQHKGQVVCIPRINLIPPTSSSYPFQFHRKQFPIKLSFAMTINKSQGQTLGQVAVYLPRPCFSSGQLYVALSRAKKASMVSVLATSPSEDGANGYVKNVVSYDVLKLAGII